jgi:hypothetical protein
MEQEIRNAPKPHILPKGAEVKVRIIRVALGQSTKEGSEGAKWFMPHFDVPADLMAKEFNTFLWDPLTSSKLSNPKSIASCKSNFDNFTRCFGIDLSKPLDLELDLPGLEGWVIVGVSPDEGFGEKNFISRYVTGSSNASRPQTQASGPINPSDIPF